MNRGKAVIRRYQSHKEVNIIYSIAMVLLPAQAALYYLASLVIDLPGVEFVLGFTVILVTVLQYIVFSQPKPYDGRLLMTEKGDGGFLFSLELGDDPESFIDKPYITFRVDKNE